LSVCPNSAITVKVIRNTSGAEIHATRASFIHIIANRLKNTRSTVISQSLTRCSRSSLILSELSSIVVIFRSFGIFPRLCISSSLATHSSIRLTIDQPLFFTIQRVTALEGSVSFQSVHLYDNLDRVVLFLGASIIFATSLRYIIQLFHVFEITKFFRDCISKNLSSRVTVCLYLPTLKSQIGIVKLSQAIAELTAPAVKLSSSNFFGSYSTLNSTWSQPDNLASDTNGFFSSSSLIFLA
jgi:hypothetical protein